MLATPENRYSGPNTFKSQLNLIIRTMREKAMRHGWLSPAQRLAAKTAASSHVAAAPRAGAPPRKAPPECGDCGPCMLLSGGEAFAEFAICDGAMGASRAPHTRLLAVGSVHRGLQPLPPLERFAQAPATCSSSWIEVAAMSTRRTTLRADGMIGAAMGVSAAESPESLHEKDVGADLIAEGS